MIIGKTRTNQPVEGEPSGVAKALEGQDVKVKTLEQTDDNWNSGDITLNNDWLNGLTAHNAFVRMIKINKSLHVIISTTLENETESDITTGEYKPVILKTNVPENITSKIYRKDGTACNVNAQPAQDQIVIWPIEVSNVNGTDFTEIGALLYSSLANQLAVWLSAGESITIAAGQSKFIDFRLEVVL